MTCSLCSRHSPPLSRTTAVRMPGERAAVCTDSHTPWPPLTLPPSLPPAPPCPPSSARDSESSEKVAIKKITGCFESPVDAKRMLREVKLLSHLRHENVIGLRDILPPPSPSAAAYKVRAGRRRRWREGERGSTAPQQPQTDGPGASRPGGSWIGRSSAGVAPSGSCQSSFSTQAECSSISLMSTHSILVLSLYARHALMHASPSLPPSLPSLASSLTSFPAACCLFPLGRVPCL